MQNSGHGRIDELREFLQEHRHLRQRDVAALAGVSLSLYKRLEAGEVWAVRLDFLLRIADALGLGDRERATFIRLARPDLDRLLAVDVQTRAASLLRLPELRELANQLARTRGTIKPVRRAVEVLQAVLRPDGASFALHSQDARGLRVSFCVGTGSGHFDALRRRVFPVPAALIGGKPYLVGGSRASALPADLASAGVRSTACIPIAAPGGGLLTVIGVASRSSQKLSAEAISFLQTVGAILEVRLRRA